MTPERIADLVLNNPIVNDLAHLRGFWLWEDRGRGDARYNEETEEPGGDIEARALEIVYGLRLEGWSTLQRAKILAHAVNRAAWSLGPAGQEKFYEAFNKRKRFAGLRAVWRGVKGDWRVWTGRQ